MKHTIVSNGLQKIGGYLLVPYELLHVIGFRLVGKRCDTGRFTERLSPHSPPTLAQLDAV